MASICNDLGNSLKALENLYAAVDGLMRDAANRSIVKGLVTEIDLKFASLMVNCAGLTEEDHIPGTKCRKTNIRRAKQEFDARVKDWFDLLDMSLTNDIIHPQTPPVMFNESFGLDKSKLSTRSGCLPVLDLKKKENKVKLKRAAIKKEKEVERLRLSEETNRVLLEADKCLEYAKREAARLKERVKRERELRERSWEIELAKVEAEALVEPCSYSDSGQYRGLDGYSTIHKRLLDKDCGQQDRETEIGNEISRSKLFASVEELDNLQSTLRLLKLSNDKQNYKYQPLRGRVDSSLPRTEGVKCLSTAGKVGRTDNIGGLPSQAPPEFGSLAPKRMGVSPVTSDLQHHLAPLRSSASVGGAVSSDAERATENSGTQDYPPPRPVIQVFDGNPMTYWPFIRSFETHISSRLSSGPAKLVYLLQHCSPGIRKNLEHFSRDTESGYEIARDSLFNDYGQPHITAYCCEQKLLNALRIKVKEASSLKNMAVLMEKCLSMLIDIKDFATLNSLGTIRCIMEKLPEQMQKDWVSLAFKHFKSTGSQAKFPELVQFVRDVSDEANSLCGKLFYGSNRMTTSQPVSLKKATVFNNVASTGSEFRNNEFREVNCPLCEQNHKLSACGPKKFYFQKRNLSERTV